MSRLEVPLLGKRLQATGDVLIRAELDLLLRDDNGVWKPATFRVDSGTEMTTMPAAEAIKLGLPVPRNAVPGLTIHTPGGQGPVEVRAGLIRARVLGMDATEYVFPCYFVGELTNPGPSSPRNLLALSGVIDKIEICFDGTPAARAPYGYLVVQKK